MLWCSCAGRSPLSLCTSAGREGSNTSFKVLMEQRKCSRLEKVGTWTSSSSHLICDLSTVSGMEDIWRVGDRGVLEVVRLLSVLFLLQGEEQDYSLFRLGRFQGESSPVFCILKKEIYTHNPEKSSFCENKWHFFSRFFFNSWKKKFQVFFRKNK